MKAQSPNHWTAREFSNFFFLYFKILSIYLLPISLEDYFQTCHSSHWNQLGSFLKGLSATTKVGSYGKLQPSAFCYVLLWVWITSLNPREAAGHTGSSGRPGVGTDPRVTGGHGISLEATSRNH